MMVRLLFLVFMVLGGWATAMAALVEVPALTARVTDLTATLSPQVRQGLETQLAELETRKGSQLAVLMVPTTGEETVEQYSIRAVERWRLGRKGIDDGLLLLVAKDDRKLRIEVGYGLEGAIPDAVAKRVIEEVIVPRFKAGDFAGGVISGVDALIGLVDGEPLPEPEPNSLSSIDVEDALPLIMLFVFVVGGILRAIFGPLLGAGVAGGVAFFGAWWLAGTIVLAVIIAVVVFILTLLGLASGIGGGGGGGGRGGGFSGGGGGFGGGGASGSW